jgi:hypothetical protein
MTVIWFCFLPHFASFPSSTQWLNGFGFGLSSLFVLQPLLNSCRCITLITTSALRQGRAKDAGLEKQKQGTQKWALYQCVTWLDKPKQHFLFIKLLYWAVKRWLPAPLRPYFRWLLWPRSQTYTPQGNCLVHSSPFIWRAVKVIRDRNLYSKDPELTIFSDLMSLDWADSVRTP